METVNDSRKLAIVCSREDIVSLSCALRPLSLSLGYIAKRVGTRNMYLLEFVAFLFLFFTSSLVWKKFVNFCQKICSEVCGKTHSGKIISALLAREYSRYQTADNLIFSSSY